MAVVSMTQAIKDGDKVFVGDMPVHLTAPGKMGMVVAAGDTLQKLVQAIVLRDKFGPEATDEVKALQLVPFAGEILQESQIFSGCIWDLDEPVEEGEPEPSRQDIFNKAVEDVVYGLIILMNLAKVNTEAEKAMLNQAAQQMGLAKMKQASNLIDAQNQQAMGSSGPRRF